MNTYLLKDVMKSKFNNGINQKDLWKYVENKKEKEYNIEDIKHWVYHPCWSETINNKEYFYNIYQVLSQKSKFKKDMKRIKNSDETYPIIVVEDEFDKYGVILDGNHRFAKLIINNVKKIKFKYIGIKEFNKIKNGTIRL